MDHAVCIHCGRKGLIERDARNEPLEKRCAGGHPFEYTEIIRPKRRREDIAPPSAGPRVARGN